MMYDVRCTIYDVRCTMHYVRCTMYYDDANDDGDGVDVDVVIRVCFTICLACLLFLRLLFIGCSL